MGKLGGLVALGLAALVGCKSVPAGPVPPCEWAPSPEDIYEWRLDLVEGEGAACKGRIYFSNIWNSDTIVPGWCNAVSVSGCDAEMICRHQDSTGVSRLATISLSMDSAFTGTAEVTHEDVCVGEYELSVRRLDDFEP
jgi:hypothetical protein